MTSKGLLIVVAIPIVVLLVLEVVLGAKPGRRNYEIFTEMAYSAANESLSPSANLPLGMTQQGLVEGVIVRGHTPFRFGPGPDEARRAGEELVNPYADEPEVLARGAVLYGRFCTTCHAPDGSGKGPVPLRSLLKPASLLGARAMSIADGEVFHILTLGQGTMAPFAVQLTPDDRWKVIRYLRTIQEPAR